MAYDIKGTVHRVGDVQQISETFRKREFVLLVPDGKYPQYIPMELTGDRISMADELRIGDELRVTFNLRGRETNKNGQPRCWLSCDVWKLEVTAKAAGSTTEAAKDDSLPF